jgi:hypothetical protein
MAQVQRRMVLCNIDISDIGVIDYAMTPAVQIPNGATKITVQFKYGSITSPVTCTLFQSLDGLTYDLCETVDEMPISIILDVASTSATLNISELLTTWIRFKVEKGSAIAGTLNKFLVLFAA